MKRFASLLTLVAGLAIASNAPAATITQQFTQPQTGTNWNVNDIAFNQFDPSLGTLTSVLLSYEGSFTQEVTLTVGNINVSQNVDLLTSSATVRIYDAANLVNQITALTATDALITTTTSFAPNTSTVYNGAGDFDFGPAAQLRLAPYIGLGTKSFSLRGTGTVEFEADGQIGIAISTFSGGTLTLVYEYTIAPPPIDAVPEPTTMAGAVAGLLALVPVARRRLAKKA